MGVTTERRKTMKYPKFLPENGTIGFVAPSFGCATEPYHTAFLNAQKKWKAMGYQLDLGPNCYADNGIGISNTPQACGKELTDYYCSVDNDVLISCGGGEMMCETIGYVDFEKINFSSDTTPRTLGSRIKVKKADRSRFSIRNENLNEPLGIYDVAFEYTQGGNFKG